MIRTTENQTQPMHPRDRLDRHPLGIAAQVTRTVGIAIMAGGLFVFAMTIAFCLATSASAVPTALIAGGVAFGGATLVHQATGLAHRVMAATTTANQ